MSRFDSGRRLRVAVWTGAALAWGTTAAMAAQRVTEADSAQDFAPVPGQQTIDTPTTAPVPTLPAGGLVILRFQPPPEAQQEVRVVRVQADPSPAPGVSAAPQPTSSGS